jgi:hypothetical protein
MTPATKALLLISIGLPFGAVSFLFLRRGAFLETFSSWNGAFLFFLLGEEATELESVPRFRLDARLLRLLLVLTEDGGLGIGISGFQNRPVTNKLYFKRKVFKLLKDINTYISNGHFFFFK